MFITEHTTDKFLQQHKPEDESDKSDKVFHWTMLTHCPNKFSRNWPKCPKLEMMPTPQQLKASRIYEGSANIVCSKAAYVVNDNEYRLRVTSLWFVLNYGLFSWGLEHQAARRVTSLHQAMVVVLFRLWVARNIFSRIAPDTLECALSYHRECCSMWSSWRQSSISRLDCNHSGAATSKLLVSVWRSVKAHSWIHLFNCKSSQKSELSWDQLADARWCFIRNFSHISYKMSPMFHYTVSHGHKSFAHSCSLRRFAFT